MAAREQETFVSDILRRSWWRVVAGVCIGALVALVVLRHTPEVFEAHATIKVDVSEIHLRNLRDAVLSDANLHRVIVWSFLKSSSPEAERALSPEGEQALAGRIRSRVAFRYVPLSREINVHYRDHDPDRAAQVTNWLALFCRLEGLEREDIVIVALAAPPSVPVFPDPWVYLGVGVAGGLLLFVGPVLGRVILKRAGMGGSAMRFGSALLALGVGAATAAVGDPTAPEAQAAEASRSEFRVPAEFRHADAFVRLLGQSGVRTGSS